MDGRENKKIEQLQSFTKNNEGKEMTTNTGVKISNDENSLTAGGLWSYTNGRFSFP